LSPLLADPLDAPWARIPFSAFLFPPGISIVDDLKINITPKDFDGRLQMGNFSVALVLAQDQGSFLATG
jgi:hypothetical protein